MNIEELADNHKNDFPGYTLVDYYDAAFPMYVFQLKVLLQIKKTIPVVQEYLLRAIDAGQNNLREIALLLGLEPRIVQIAAVELEQRSYVIPRRFDSSGRNELLLHLTSKGQAALRELVLSEPEKSSLAVCVDALTHEILPFRPLRQPKDVKDLYHVIPTYVAQPTLEALKHEFVTLKKLVSEQQRNYEQNRQEYLQERHLKRPKRDLIELIQVEKSWTAYRLMRILQYIRPKDNSLQLQVYDGNERSNTHEGVLLRMEEGDTKFRPLRSVSQSEVPDQSQAEIPIEIQRLIPAAERKAIEIPRLQREIQSKQQALEEPKSLLTSELVIERQEAVYLIEKLKEEINEYEQRIEELEAGAKGTEVLQMHQHRAKLFQALDQAKSHVIIISPWLSLQAIDYEVQKQIGLALSRGIDIYLGHGFGPPDRKEKETLPVLKNLAQKKRGRLIRHRFDDVHSKVLICDTSFMVLTSFNWLSFSGDTKRGSRVEDGVLIRDYNLIIEKTREWLGRFDHSKAAHLRSTLLEIINQA